MTTILLVEDNILLADCYIQWLNASGYKVVHVTTAQDALDACDQEVPQAIMLDILLPGANGIQLLHVIQSHADVRGVPVIMCSNALPDDHSVLRAYGVRSVLNKATLTRPRLERAIKAALA